MRIALLEDDPAQAELMIGWLGNAGHDCHHFTTGGDFLKAVAHDSFDLAVLDWGLPDMQGDEVLTSVRDRLDWRIPVLFVTSRDQEEDVVHALELGADDYMSKPVRRGEALARVNALLRRSMPTDPAERVHEFAPYTFDTQSHAATVDGEPVDLTQREFELAVFLFKNVGRLVSRGHILETVWGTRPDLNTRTVDTHISRIRTKLGLSPAAGWRLSSVYQHGYRLEQLDSEPGKAAC
ncbi:MAG: response regulator transcription factor [Gammaproteobacteria bacterium]|nr:response regulator transcription factor [Gammaproteobacteria bacterium]